MRKLFAYLALMAVCQALTLSNVCHAESALDKSLDKLLGTPPVGSTADTFGGTTTAQPGAAMPSAPAKPAKEKKHRERKPAPDLGNASSSAADAPAASSSSAGTVDKNLDKKIEKGLDKLFGTSPPSVYTPQTGAAPSTDSSSTSLPPASDGTTTSLPASTDAGSGGMTPAATEDSSTSAPSSADSSSAADSIKEEDTYTDNQIKAGDLNNQAVIALNAGQYQKAIELLKQALAIWPTYEQGKNNLRVAYYNAAVDLSNHAKWKESWPYLQKAMELMKELHRNDADVINLYAQCKKVLVQTH